MQIRVNIAQQIINKNNNERADLSWRDCGHQQRINSFLFRIASIHFLHTSTVFPVQYKISAHQNIYNTRLVLTIMFKHKGG